MMRATDPDLAYNILFTSLQDAAEREELLGLLDLWQYVKVWHSG